MHYTVLVHCYYNTLPHMELWSPLYFPDIYLELYIHIMYVCKEICPRITNYFPH